MTDLPLLSISMVTYKRTPLAIRTIRSTIQHLQYPRELITWFIGDDGSGRGHEHALREALAGQRLGEYSNERWRFDGQEETFFAGQVWNHALGVGHQNSDFVLWLEDDWEMEQDLNLAPYVKLLQEREEVGIVTFRILSVGAEVITVGHNGEIYLHYGRRTQYGYCGHPHLRHARWTRFYGWFHEERTPGDMEIDMDARYREMQKGPQVWRPATLDAWGGWHHIGQEKTWK